MNNGYPQRLCPIMGVRQIFAGFCSHLHESYKTRVSWLWLPGYAHGTDTDDHTMLLALHSGDIYHHQDSLVLASIQVTAAAAA
jgi:hypothetical protein